MLPDAPHSLVGEAEWLDCPEPYCVEPLALIRAIDVGSEISHVVLYDRHTRRVVLVEADVPNAFLLAQLRDWSIHPPITVIETIEPRGQALGHSTVDTILWVGRFQEASRGALLGRSQVYKHLVGKDRNDAAIRQVLIDKLGPPRIFRIEVGAKGGRKKVSKPGPTAGVSGDLWQALGLAVTYAETILGVEP